MRVNKLLTRKEIIQLWSQQSEEMLNSYCCPGCRDLLFETEKYYICKNTSCKLFHCTIPKNSILEKE